MSLPLRGAAVGALVGWVLGFVAASAASLRRADTVDVMAKKATAGAASLALTGAAAGLFAERVFWTRSARR